MPLDIGAHAVNDTAEIPLRDAADQPILGDDGAQASITVYGPGSRAYQRAMGEQQTRLVQAMQRKGKPEETPEARALRQAQTLAACTVAFNGFGYKGLSGHELFVAVYSEPALGFIADQVNRAIGDWANFTKSSAKS